MTILEGIKNLKGFGVEIPGVGRDDLPEFFKTMGYKVGAEIGVDRGDFSEVLCRDGLKLYSIDPWGVYSDYYRQNLPEKLDRYYEEAKQRLAPYDCTVVRKTSMEAVKDFEDESLDFVYIDGHHGFKFVTEDIFEWSKKIKKGGTICGHDYVYTKTQPTSPYACHVRYVVDAYTKAFNIANWYVLGRKNAPEGEKRDQWRSWLWIKE